MPDLGSKNALAVVGTAIAVGLLLLIRPAYFADASWLGMIVAAEILFFAILKFRKAFFPVLMGTFLGAGISSSLHGAFVFGRWLVLGIGAAAGMALFIKGRNHHFSTFHLVAASCLLAAVVSALVSAYPEEALLKTLSLVLLFMYAASGGRIAAARTEERPNMFFHRMVTACEVLNVFTAVSYFVLHWEFFGNPNSLGATMGIVVIPLLLWGFFVSETISRRRRLTAGLLLAILLLMSSFARAGIAAAALSCFLWCAASRQYRLLLKGVVAAGVLAVVAAIFVSQPSDMPKTDVSQPVAATFLYKGHREGGVLASRKGVWRQTWDAIKQNPWCGSGFGTSIVTDDKAALAFAKHHIDSWVVREHGNSYLEIVEWVGLLGVLPFYALVVLAAVNLKRVFSWVRRTGDTQLPAVPVAMVVAAGLVHAAFEDWLFAVGYYLCVFFWTMVFILVDVVPRPAAVWVLNPPAAIPDAQLQTLPAASAS